MCGGRDSLNLLLLPWNNPVVALSAEPNYQNAVEFVKKNNLNIEVKKLIDIKTSEIQTDENMECCCRIDMIYWRWGVSLRKVMAEYDFKAIIWKGQFGDNILTPYWKEYIYPKTKVRLFFAKVFRKISFLMPVFLQHAIGEKILPQTYERAWDIASQRQGAHMGFIRAISGVLAVSAYHGKGMTALNKKVNLARAVQKDIRKDIGRILMGKDVWYPDNNPSPAVSNYRINNHNPDLLIKNLKEHGIQVFG